MQRDVRIRGIVDVVKKTGGGFTQVGFGHRVCHIERVATLASNQGDLAPGGQHGQFRVSHIHPIYPGGIDGEIEEGSVWEAAMNAAHNKLNKIIAFVDRNKLQIDGSTENVKSVGDVKAKFEAFGWNTIEIDGHNIQEIYSAINTAKQSNKPFAIIANTVKGKGVSFMENNAGWHGKAPSDEDLQKALEELK